MRARTAVLLAAVVLAAVGAAVLVLKVGRWQLYADRHRIEQVRRQRLALFRTFEYPNLPILAKKTKKTGYIEHCQAVRLDDDGETTKELTGPGSAWMELDAALHRVIGVGAAAVTTWLTTRPGGRR